MFPMSCTNTVLGDKGLYSTLIRLASPHGKMGRAFKQIFTHYRWSRTAMLIREGRGGCESGANSIKHAFRGTNITIAEWIEAPRNVKQREIEDYLLRLRGRARSGCICIAIYTLVHK